MTKMRGQKAVMSLRYTKLMEGNFAQRPNLSSNIISHWHWHTLLNHHLWRDIDKEGPDTPVNGAINNVCAAMYRAQESRVRDVVKMARVVKSGLKNPRQCCLQGFSLEPSWWYSSIENDRGKHRAHKPWNGNSRHRIGSDGRKEVEERTSPPVAGLFGHVEFSEYPFLRLSPSCSLGKEEMRYFAQKGCFHIPAQPALDTLVRAYFKHVHPYSPILDEASFWNSYRQHSSAPSKPISLFVFQALLFVCCTVSYTKIISTQDIAD